MQVLTRKVNVKIFAPGNKKFERVQFAAPAGKALTESGVNNALMQAVEMVEKKYQNHEYKLVPIGKYDFNVVWVSEKKDDATA
jgi:hypothetical protein